MAFTEFYVTKGSAVSNLNGGGPSLGTNDAPVDVSTNCSSDGAGTAITDDDAGGWPNAAVGDFICFDAGGTPEYGSRITDITGEVLTVTPAVTASQSGKTVNVGGAWATIDHAASTVTTAFVNAAGNSPRVNIKATSAYAENVVLDNSGSNTVPLTFEGYTAAAGDGGQCEVTGQAGADVIHAAAGKNYIRLLNIYAHTAENGHSAFECDIDHGHFHNCKAFATGTGGIGFDTHGLNNLLFKCLVTASTSYGFWDGDSITYIACKSIDAGSDAFHADGAALAIDCIADTPAGDGFVQETNTQMRCYACTVYNSAGGSGVKIQGTAPSGAFAPFTLNCVLYGNNQYGIELVSGFTMPLLADYNAFDANGVGDRLNVDAGLHDVDDPDITGDPFTDAPGSDFSLNDTANRGAACRDAGIDGGDL